MTENPFEASVEDLNVMRACLSTGTRVTEPVLNATWRWFSDVEIRLPIPPMGFTEEQRISLASSILDEMVENFTQAATLWDAAPDGVTPREVAAPQIDAVDALWRELAGCFAEAINRTVPELPEEAKASLYESGVAEMSEAFGVSEEEVRETIKTDTTFRMTLRRQGFDPDQVR